MAQRFRKPNKYIPINILEEDEQKQAEDTVNDTHTHTHIRRLEISGHRSLCLISRVTGVKGLVMIRSDHIITKEETGRKPHRVDVDISKFIFVYFILWKKETLFFQKQSHLPLCCWGRVQQFARPHPATTTLQLHIDKTTTIAS